MTSPTLYAIAADLAALDELLDAVDQTDAEAAGILAQFWVESDEAEKNKIDRLLQWRADLAAREEALSAECVRLDALRAKADAKVRVIERSLREHFDATGVQKIETARFSVAIVKNGGRRAVELDPVVTLDDRFLRQPPKRVDMSALHDALDAGEEVPGARLAPRGTSLRIK